MLCVVGGMMIEVMVRVGETGCDNVIPSKQRIYCDFHVWSLNSTLPEGIISKDINRRQGKLR